MIPVTITIMIKTWIDIRAKQVLGASDDSENGFCKPVNAVCCTEKCTNQPQKERILGNSGWIFICCQRFYPSSDYSESDPDDIVWCFHCHYHCGLIYTEVFFIFYSCLIELRCMKGKFGPSLIRTFHIKKIKKKRAGGQTTVWTDTVSILLYIQHMWFVLIHCLIYQCSPHANIMKSNIVYSIFYFFLKRVK